VSGKKVFFTVLMLSITPNAVARDIKQDCLRSYYIKSYEQAIAVCQEAADAGHAQSQYVLGVMFLEGKGVQKNSQEGVRWLQSASRQGHVPARVKLQNIDDYGSDEVRRNLASTLWKKHTKPSTKQQNIKKAEKYLGIETFPIARPAEVTKQEPPIERVNDVVKPAEIMVHKPHFNALKVEARPAQKRPKQVEVKPVRVSSQKKVDAVDESGLMSWPQYEGLNSQETSEIARGLAQDLAEVNGNTEGSQPAIESKAEE